MAFLLKKVTTQAGVGEIEHSQIRALLILIAVMLL
jgi:hypothetical protein